MSIFDILGPVMVGPSSSHTAGAVRIGIVTRKLLGEEPKKAEILLHGSFAMTGKGHGTDKAIIAGLLGMYPDNMNIPNSFEIAKENGLSVKIGITELRKAHPNSVQINVFGETGRKLEVIASSLGGGRIEICQIDGIDTNFSGNYNTLIVHNLDQPGHIAEITSMLSHKSVNIASMHLSRDIRGGYAVMVIECDQQIPEDGLNWLTNLEGIIKVTYYNKEEEI